MDVVAVVDLRQVVHRARCLRVEEGVLPAVVVDRQVALFDVDVGRPVLAHRAELDQVRLGADVADGEQDVEVADDVVRLGVRRVPDVDHRIRRRRLLAVVDDRVGPDVADHRFDEAVVDQVADRQSDVEPGDLAPRADPFLEGRDGEERPDADLEFPLALGEVVDEVDRVAGLRQGHGGRPAQVAVATQDEDALGHAGVSRMGSGDVAPPGRGESSMASPDIDSGRACHPVPDRRARPSLHAHRR